MFDRHPGSAVRLGFVAALVMAGCGQAAADSAPRALAQIAQAASSPAAEGKLKEIIEAARKEGRLSLVLGEGTLGGGGSARLAKGFNDYYGLKLDVRFTPGPAMPNMVATVIQQYQTRRPAITDVITGYANHMTTLIEAG